MNRRTPEENATLRQRIIRAIKQKKVTTRQDVIDQFGVNINWIANNHQKYPEFKKALNTLETGCVTGEQKQRLIDKAIKLMKSGKIKTRKQLAKQLGVSLNWLPNTMSTYPGFREEVEAAGLAGAAVSESAAAKILRQDIIKAIEDGKIKTTKEGHEYFRSHSSLAAFKCFVSNSRQLDPKFREASDKILYTDRANPEDNDKLVDEFFRLFDKSGSKVQALKKLGRNHQWFHNCCTNNTNGMRERWAKRKGDYEKEGWLYVISTSPLNTVTGFGITERDPEIRLSCYNVSQAYGTVIRAAWCLPTLAEVKEIELKLKKSSSRKEQFACTPKALIAYIQKTFKVGKPDLLDLDTKVVKRKDLKPLPLT